MGISSLSKYVSLLVSTGIIVALPEEVKTLTRLALKSQQPHKLSNNLYIILAGMGANNARLAAEKLIALGTKKLISWGCAGALAPHLKAGDLIIPKHLNTIIWHNQLIKILDNNTFNIYQGQLINTPDIISTHSEKKQYYQNTQAIAVDMESTTIATIARTHNLAFLCLRSIVDPANMSLPHAITYASGSKGKISLAKLLSYLCLHPTELLPLIKLARYFHSATRSLTQLSKQLPAITSLV